MLGSSTKPRISLLIEIRLMDSKWSKASRLGFTEAASLSGKSGIPH
jgi:hypothetical protein